MGIGQRKAVKIEAFTASQAATGQWEETKVRTNTWAEVRDPSGFRAYELGQTKLGQTKTFRIRYDFAKHPNCDWRIVYDGRTWTVSTVQKVQEKKFYYDLTATSKGNE